jgi:hypothetical protein
MPFIFQPPPAIFYECLNSTNSDVSNKNLIIDKDLMDQIYFKDKFNSLIQEWEETTMFSSSASEIIENKNFKRIVKMGRKGIPFIIDEIEKNPSALVWALNIITGLSLKDRTLTVTEACKSWVKLYKLGHIS